MIGRLRYILVLVFISKTFVKAGAIIPFIACNPHSHEIFKKDKAICSHGIEKQGQKIIGKPKTRKKAVKSKDYSIDSAAFKHLSALPVFVNPLDPDFEFLIFCQHFFLRGPPFAG